jgi:phage shock protein PspC (stress-responsive transcriptional regulator)
MNKIFNINLGGYPFTIDDDAYHKLDKYLKTIRRHFSGSEGCDDIITDIEARIAELFNQELKGQPIVGMREVDRVIKVMGTPEEFGAVDDTTMDDKSTKKAKAHSTYTESRRLFRDGENKVIAGVAGGLAAYFGIHDALWIRLIFVLGFFFGGLSVLIYPILWIVLPEAKTSADKLAMTGEPINVSNIAKKVEEEISNLSDTLNEFTKEFKSKK